MTKYNELFYEPVRLFDCLEEDDGYGSEMDETQLAFLCGLIRRYKPQKIVEVGVAAGGTTSIILNCISMLKLDSQMFSIDLSTNFYGDKERKTGYLIDECKKILDMKPDHTLYTGEYAVKHLEKIGGNIDFLILDTVHSLPGELLDFLAFFPFLKEGAVVVLHDIALNHFHNQPTQIATKILFDSVFAEKLFGIIDDGTLLNIGAFTITGDTGKYIDSVFSALTLTWGYEVQKEELDLYRNFYSKYYSEDNLELFDMAARMNQQTMEEAEKDKKRIKQLKQDEFVGMYKWIETLKFRKRVYIYGCGYWGQRLYQLLNNCGIQVEAYIVSDGERKKKEIKNIFYLSEIDLDKEDVILIGVNPLLQAEIYAELSKQGIREYIIPEKYVYSYLA